MAAPARAARTTGANGPALVQGRGFIYELHVRAFFDGNGDGIGDFPGLTSKLDYLYDLGVTALAAAVLPFAAQGRWLRHRRLPAIHPAYGTLRDFKFFPEAHAAVSAVITELVLNHTSDQHPWFQTPGARRPAPLSETSTCGATPPEKYADARIIFKDYETSNWAWDPDARRTTGTAFLPTSPT